jgi:outer membrane protein TolC
MQTVTDSLSLKTIISLIIANHPSVKTAEEAINNANARIGLAKTGYYPQVDLSANYSNLQPVIKITIPSMGTFQLYPENNYSATINYKQLVYDFGRTRQNIEFENGNRALSEQTLEQVKQKLSILAVNNYYTLAFLQAAIKIKDEQLVILNQHLNYVEKMLATGSATEYEVLSTKVKISTIQSQLVDLDAALEAQQASLNSLIGTDQTVHPVVKTELSTDLPFIPADSIVSFAYHNRDEVLINEKRASLAELRYGMV